ncbi:unnamed protein product [Ceratitis capitata]|uniref:(Mediterranean fruit fly) hypothetical protein n=1 Tax=Ceratitis capitata TaxID=7213 RepID=A0A811UUF7_CERCA|nr:unnamed protein product [Ceratitis capitata]
MIRIPANSGQRHNRQEQQTTALTTKNSNKGINTTARTCEMHVAPPAALLHFTEAFVAADGIICSHIVRTLPQSSNNNTVSKQYGQHGSEIAVGAS